MIRSPDAKLGHWTGYNDELRDALLEYCAIKKAALSGRSYMLCGQAEQPVGGRLNFRLGHPGA
jgi:hypothetical protein